MAAIGKNIFPENTWHEVNFKQYDEPAEITWKGMVIMAEKQTAGRRLLGGLAPEFYDGFGRKIKAFLAAEYRTAPLCMDGQPPF